MKILKKFIFPLFLLTFSLAFFAIASPNEAANCSGKSNGYDKCIVKGVIYIDSNGNGRRDDNESLKSANTPMKLWRERANGTKYQEEPHTFKNGSYLYFREPAGDDYHIQATVPNGWECTTNNCSNKSFSFNNQNEVVTINFGMRQTSGNDGDDDVNCQAQAAPQIVPPDSTTKSPNDDGKVVFIFGLKNMSCGKRTFNLSAEGVSWNKEFKGNAQNNKVKDVKSGKTVPGIKLVLTPPSGATGNFTITLKAQDDKDSNLSATLGLTATLGGGDGGDDGDGDDETGGSGTLHLRIGLDGIGNTGDRQNPSCRFSNKNPESESIEVDVKLFKTSDGTLVRTFDNITAEYEPEPSTDEDCNPLPTSDKGKYIADINLPQGFVSQSYQIEIASEKPFKNQRSAPVTLTAGSTNNPSPINLPVGDINGDDVINVSDWTLLNQCLASGRTVNCNRNNNTYKIDLNDDGRIQNEVGFWLREFFVLE